MQLQTQCTNVLPILTFGKYTVGDTLVGRTVLKLNSGRLGGWLESEARRSATGKVAHSQSWAFGSWSRFLLACHSLRLQKQVAPRFKNSPLPKRQKFKFNFFLLRLTNARSNLRSFACRMDGKHYAKPPLLLRC